MPDYLLNEAAGGVAVFAVILGLASVLRTWIEQQARTRRLAKALENTRPSERPKIIIACSQLEGQPPADAGRVGHAEQAATPGPAQSSALVRETRRILRRQGM